MEISVRKFPKSPGSHAAKYCYFPSNPSYSSNFGRPPYDYACQKKKTPAKSVFGFGTS